MALLKERDSSGESSSSFDSDSGSSDSGSSRRIQRKKESGAEDNLTSSPTGVITANVPERTIFEQRADEWEKAIPDPKERTLTLLGLVGTMGSRLTAMKSQVGYVRGQLELASQRE